VGFVRAKVGDRYVLEELICRGWQLGGEGSGHLLALDKHTTGDGIVSALQILQAVVRTGRPLAHWLSEVQLFPQKLINVRLQPGQDWQSSSTLAAARAAVEADLVGRGRVLIRASGTEPLLRVMVEAQDQALATQCCERLVAAIKS
jgi:phosphoglucosamine mutase